ncbi:MAG TPA: GrpB family protein [Bacillota bacterium]
MAKSLDEMTNEELWKLFPIIISQPNPAWKDSYAKEKVIIEEKIGTDNIVRISHIGSTAVPNLPAKPIVDILLEIETNTDLDQLIAALRGLGYIYSPQPNNPPPHMMFMKGYTPEGFKGQVYHLHVRYSGDWDELYFRDYLSSHSDVAKRYAELKLNLKEKYEFDRDGYTAAKTDFIKNLTKLARDEMPDKYRPLSD